MNLVDAPTGERSPVEQVPVMMPLGCDTHIVPVIGGGHA